MPKRKRRHGGRRRGKDAVFLNIPYDQQFTSLFTNALPKLLADAGTNDPFQARVFKDISVFAGALADELAT
jgi:hypothetical protein